MVPRSSWQLRPVVPPSTSRASFVAGVRYLQPKLWEELLVAFHSVSTDAAIASQLQVGPRTVETVRNNLGVPTSATRRAELTAQLVGQVDDVVVAGWLGATLEDVRAFRAQYGIPEFDRDRSPTDSEIVNSAIVATAAARLLGVPTDRVRMARRFGHPLRPAPAPVPPPRPTPTRGRIKVDWAELPIGQVSDRALAQQTGRDRGSIGKYRRSVGAPAFTPEAPTGSKAVDWDALPLFTRSLVVLAHMTGLSKSTVKRARAARLAKS